MSSVVVVGSLNSDLVVALERLPEPGETVLGLDLAHNAGGKGLNQSVAAARAGAAVSLVGAVGQDDAGRRLSAVVEEEGIVARLTSISGAPSGTALIEVDAAGENRIVVVPGANGRLTGSAVVDGLRAGPVPDVVLTQAEIPLAAVSAALRVGRELGSTTVLNPSPADHLPVAVLADVDVLVTNEHEAAQLSGVVIATADDAMAAARALRGHGPRVVVVTRGAAGAVWSAHDGDGTAASYAVDVVDTVGAGDAFCGALVAQLASGTTLAAAVDWACAAGALATGRRGAVPSLPRRDEIDRLLRA